MTPPVSQTAGYHRDASGHPVRYHYKWRRDPEHWQQVVTALTNSDVHDTQGLVNLLGRVRQRDTSARGIVSLVQAITELESELDAFTFYPQLLPALKQAVLSAPDVLGDSCALLFHDEGTGQVQFTHYQAYVVACLAFFGLTPPLHAQYSDQGHRLVVRERFGDLDWFPLYSSPAPVAVARIKCQLAYLHVIASRSTREDDTFITLYRTVLPGSGVGANDTRDAPMMWSESEVRLSNTRVHVSDQDKIEDVVADAHIDFANKYLHIGQIIPSATQEEVLFSIRPECFIGLLIAEMMQDEECIVITGARRFTNYTGYLQTFRYAGIYTGEQGIMNQVPAIVAMDAIVNINDMQFDAQWMTRDLAKAYLGFSGVRDRVTLKSISTGKWGCGAFMGDPTLKFIQQVLAAAQAGVTDFHYSTFHRPDEQQQHIAIIQGLQAQNVTVGQLYRFLIEFASTKSTDNRDVWDRMGHDRTTRFVREVSKLAGLAPEYL